MLKNFNTPKSIGLDDKWIVGISPGISVTV